MNVHLVRAAASLCLLASLTAVAGASAELTARLEELAKGATVTPQEKKALSDGLKDWLSARERCFKDLIELIEEDSPSRQEQEAAWVQRVKQARADLGKTLGDSLRNVSTPTVHALGYRATVVQEEDRMLEALEQAKVGEKRDLIVKNQAKVKEMTSLLEEKWNGGILSIDKSLDEQEKAVIQELQDLAKETVDEWSRENTRIIEKIGLFVSRDKSKQPATLSPTSPILIDINGLVLGQMEILIKKYGKYAELRSKLQQYQQSERGGVFVLFREVRKDTELFLRENEFPRAKRAYEEAKDGMGKVASACTTSAQREDISNLTSELLSKLSRHLSATESVQNEFIKRNERKFYGPLGPDIKEALLETRQWEDWSRQFSSLDLDAHLRKFRSAADGFYEVSVSGLTSAEKDLLKGVLKEDHGKLYSLCEQWAKDYGELEELHKKRREAERDLE
jgi:hypothetical protein